MFVHLHAVVGVEAIDHKLLELFVRWCSLIDPCVETLHTFFNRFAAAVFLRLGDSFPMLLLVVFYILPDVAFLHASACIEFREFVVFIKGYGSSTFELVELARSYLLHVFKLLVQDPGL